MKRSILPKMVDPRKHSEAKLARMTDIVRERVRRERREAAEAEKKAADEEKRAKAMPHVNGIAKADESGPPLVVKTESGLVVKTESAGSSGAPATPAPPKEPEPKKVEPPSDEAIAEMQEELETLQHKKHLLFVKLKGMLKEEEEQKAAAAAAEAERREREQQRLEEQEREREQQRLEEEERRYLGSSAGPRPARSSSCSNLQGSSIGRRDSFDMREPPSDPRDVGPGSTGGGSCSSTMWTPRLSGGFGGGGPGGGGGRPPERMPSGSCASSYHGPPLGHQLSSNGYRAPLSAPLDPRVGGGGVGGDPRDLRDAPRDLRGDPRSDPRDATRDPRGDPRGGGGYSCWGARPSSCSVSCMGGSSYGSVSGYGVGGGAMWGVDNGGPGGGGSDPRGDDPRRGGVLTNLDDTRRGGPPPPLPPYKGCGSLGPPPADGGYKGAGPPMAQRYPAGPRREEGPGGRGMPPSGRGGPPPMGGYGQGSGGYDPQGFRGNGWR